MAGTGTWNVDLSGLIRSSYAGISGDFADQSDEYNARQNDIAQGSGGFIMFETLQTGQPLPGQSVSVAPIVNNIKSAAKDYLPMIVIVGGIVALVLYFFRKK